MATNTPPSIDFSRVQYGEPAEARPEACLHCGRGLETEHYHLNGQAACSTCVQNTRELFPADSHRAYMGALLWGIPAAIIGMLLYAGFEIVTHIAIGWIAIGVGYLVAKAMHRGSGGVGGRRYQWTAVLLTYAAVALAFLPVAFAEVAKDKPKPAAVSDSSPSTLSHAASGTPAADTAPKSAEKPAEPQHGWLYGIAFLLGIGLISPFYELFTSFGSGLIGLLVLFWGMRTAWSMTAAPAVKIEGPFPLDAA